MDARLGSRQPMSKSLLCHEIFWMTLGQFPQRVIVRNKWKKRMLLGGPMG